MPALGMMRSDIAQSAHMPPQPHHDSPSGHSPTAAGDDAPTPALSAAERAALAQGTEEAAQHSLEQSASTGAMPLS